MRNKQINGQKRIKNIKKIAVLFIFLVSLHWISGGRYAVEVEKGDNTCNIKI